MIVADGFPLAEGGRDTEEGGWKRKGASLCLWGSARQSRLDSLQRVEGSFVWKSSDSLINLEDRLAECDSAGADNMVSGNTHDWTRRRREKKMVVEGSASGGVAG